MDISKVFHTTVEELFCFEGGVKQRGAGGTYLRRARAGHLSPGEGLGDGGWILHPPLRVLRRRTDTDLS